MNYDQTLVTLTGATIHTAKRDGIWLVLTLTDKDGTPHELHFSGRTTKGTAYCGKCGEDRQIETVRDKGMRPRAFCCVCAHDWELVT